MTLDTSKPMMTRDGRKVVEFHVFKGGTIAAIPETSTDDTVVIHFPGTANPALVNCPPEPVVLWLSLMVPRHPHTGWGTAGLFRHEHEATNWASVDPANRRVVRVEVPNP